MRCTKPAAAAGFLFILAARDGCGKPMPLLCRLIDEFGVDGMD